MLVADALLNLNIRLAANESPVNFDNRSGAAHWGKIARPHAFADAMSHEPCGSIRSKTKHTEQLMSAHALL
jgi:hypothetical protein